MGVFMPPLNHRGSNASTPQVSVDRRAIRSAMRTIADRLRQARSDLGITQQELGRRAGVSQKTIAKIEAGRTQRPIEILAIAKAAQVEPEWLLEGRRPSAAVQPKLRSLR